MTPRGMRYLYLSAIRTRAPVLGMIAFAFALFGIYADPRAEAGSTFALTALLTAAFTAWIVGATLGAEPNPQSDIVAAALGGRHGRLRVDVLLVVVVTTVATVCFVGWPLVLSAAGRDVFARDPDGTDVLAGILAHLMCGLIGGAIGVAFAPPRVVRRATAAVLTLILLLALTIVSIPLGHAGGPVAIAVTMSDAPLHHFTGSEVAALASSLVLLAGASAGVWAWTTRVG